MIPDPFAAIEPGFERWQGPQYDADFSQPDLTPRTLKEWLRSDEVQKAIAASHPRPASFPNYAKRCADHTAQLQLDRRFRTDGSDSRQRRKLLRNNNRGRRGCNGNTVCGTLFQNTPTGTLTTLHSFCANGWPNCPDGDAPYWMIQDSDGNFYGTTAFGGDSSACSQANPGCGTAYKLSMGFGPFVTFVLNSGKVGAEEEILGQGFTGTTRRLLQRNCGKLHGPFRHLSDGDSSPRGHHRLRNRYNARRHAAEQRSIPGEAVGLRVSLSYDALTAIRPQKDVLPNRASNPVDPGQGTCVRQL